MTRLWAIIFGKDPYVEEFYLWNPTSEEYVQDGCGNTINFETEKNAEAARKLYGKELVVHIKR